MLISKTGKVLKQIFLQRSYPSSQQVYLNHQGMQMKTKMRYHLSPAWMAIIQNKTKTKMISIGEDVEKLEPLYIIHKNVK